MTTHTIEEALETFELVSGTTGSEADHKACAMSLISWVAGEEWSDHPECAHPLIASFVINANDDEATTPEQRAEIFTAGEHGILDTWWIPSDVILFALSGERDEEITAAERTLRALGRIAGWKVNKTKPNLVRANLVGANLVGANLVGANLVGANLIRANLVRANLYGANLVRANLVGANLDGANLVGANLVGARGNKFTTLPAGYKVNESGLIVRSA